MDEHIGTCGGGRGHVPHYTSFTANESLLPSPKATRTSGNTERNSRVIHRSGAAGQRSATWEPSGPEVVCQFKPALQAVRSNW